MDGASADGTNKDGGRVLPTQAEVFVVIASGLPATECRALELNTFRVHPDFQYAPLESRALYVFAMMH